MSLSCTGYTNFIQNGKVTTATDFLKLCLRNFGILMHLRDESLSPDIPREIQKDDYHVKSLATAKEKLAKYNAMSSKEWEEKLAETLKSEEEHLEAYEKESKDFTDKLNAIKTEVLAWPCGKEYESVKKFALDQIEISMPTKSDWMYNTVKRLKEIKPEDYRKECIEGVEREIEYHIKGDAEEAERNRSANEYLTGFWKSLEQLGGSNYGNPT